LALPSDLLIEICIGMGCSALTSPAQERKQHKAAKDRFWRVTGAKKVEKPAPAARILRNLAIGGGKCLDFAAMRQGLRIDSSIRY
jgi:hypothetical protein